MILVPYLHESHKYSTGKKYLKICAFDCKFLLGIYFWIVPSITFSYSFYTLKHMYTYKYIYIYMYVHTPERDQLDVMVLGLAYIDRFI